MISNILTDDITSPRPSAFLYSILFTFGSRVEPFLMRHLVDKVTHVIYMTFYAACETCNDLAIKDARDLRA